MTRVTALRGHVNCVDHISIAVLDDYCVVNSVVKGTILREVGNDLSRRSHYMSESKDIINYHWCPLYNYKINGSTHLYTNRSFGS